ncbi:nucleoside/nucleotide kinase family protein [Streptomyces sp. SID10853]|uniref:nucleoside/nucleotide kinase family protein n=1 Tax=Streptomyces sp. SID10853 TaxID=2706028 RepID=UPI0013BEC190|nr:nucleoside/nucleotide kinase family protein [Streptomyces sp. SID10853]NDZ81731.1 nucleoside/nucleotide kinase family protein [Streptomyces sp. SID10853]
MTPQRLIDRARLLASAGHRRILGIAGPPGAGKSTLAAGLAEALGPSAVVVPMDGFHLAGAELRRLGRADRKGAPDTFDEAGYAALLARLRTPGGDVVYAPAFDRALEEPVAGSVPVAPEVPLVITEGNYLLHWPLVRALLDEAWFIGPGSPEDPADAARVSRLIERHIRYGRSRVEAERWVLRSDEANARLVARTRDRADLVVPYPCPCP